jgi:hypothetical protein
VKALCLFASLLLLSLGQPTAAAAAPHWYRCNTHTHTASYPDAGPNASAAYAAGWYKAHGYQCLFITDHEHLTPVDEINNELGRDGTFLAIQGEEITQGIRDPKTPDLFRAYHVNGLNTSKVLYPEGFPANTPPDKEWTQTFIRTIPTGVSPGQIYIANINKVYGAGGIPQVNHPSRPLGPTLEDLQQIKRPFLLEVWNAFPSIGPLGGVDENGVVSPSFESLWDSLLSQGKTVWGVASDDTHDYIHFDDPSAPTPGHAWIVVQAPELTLPAIMEALHSGNFYASTGVALKDYQVNATGISMTIDRPKDSQSMYRTRFIGREGKVLAELTGLSAHYTFKRNESYVRASIIDSDGRRAWTQPVFRDNRSTHVQ